jgi:hypothetical protein
VPPGFVAATRDASKRRASSALPFVPMSVESFGRRKALALTLLDDLAGQAVQAGGPGLSWAAFLSGALRELSVALCRVNASLCRSGAHVATRATGRTAMRVLAQRSTDMVETCIAPRVRVWGFCFGYALRCVALLGGVCVRLCPVLFLLAGLFFLLSLCETYWCPSGMPTPRHFRCEVGLGPVWPLLCFKPQTM